MGSQALTTGRLHLRWWPRIHQRQGIASAPRDVSETSTVPERPRTTPNRQRIEGGVLPLSGRDTSAATSKAQDPGAWPPVRLGSQPRGIRLPR